jgi:hypothetical protein
MRGRRRGGPAPRILVIIDGGQVKRRLAAATTAVFAALAAVLLAPAAARADDGPITDIGISAGTVVNGPVVLRPTIADGADITSIKIDAESSGFGDLGQGSYSAPWVLSWDPSDFSDQEVTLTLIAVDSAGEWHRSAPVSVYVDRVAPLFTIDNPIEPGWGWYQNAHQPIRLTATDRAGVAGAELLQNGKLIDSVTVNGSVSAKVALLMDPSTRNGATTVTIRLVDTAGNSVENDLTLTVDNDKPTGTFRPSGTYLRGTIHSWAYSENDNFWVLSMASYLDAHKGGGVTDREPFDVYINSHVVADGKHTLSFELTDLAGNTDVVRRTVYIDNTPPSVSLTTAPKNNAKLTKKQTLKAKATDKYGVTKVQLLVNGKVVATDTTAGYQFTLNPAKYGKKFTMQMRAYDKAGNLRYSTKRTYRR